MNKELQRLVFPTTEFIDNEKLFVRKEEKEANLFDGSLTKVSKYTFNTYMNMFAASKWDKYCELGDISLKLEIDGKYRVQVVGSQRNLAFGVIDNVILEQDIDSLNYSNGIVNILIPDAKKYEGLYFSIFAPTEQQIKIKSGAWCTDKEPLRENKLAIVTCTFKREDYIAKTMTKFTEFIKSNSELKDKIKMIIVDNGKTVDINKGTESIKVFPNMNAGGAGGFTRGLMEAMKSGEDYTRILFMDDDVEIFPESFYRTLMLSNYLKEGFENSIINGAMLDIYKKSQFFENLALQNKLWVSAYKCNLPLNKYKNILKTNDIPDEVFENPNVKVDSAWWYSCFNINVAKEKGLPLPVFFRGDDVEWGWRQSGQHHISMNGICVWHEPFEWRVSRVAENYYLPRNMFMLNSLYTTEFKNTFKNLFIEKFEYLSKTYDYVSLDIFLRAMDDILTGSTVFRENPEEQFKDINLIAKKAEYISSINDGDFEFAKKYRPKKNAIKKFIYKITNYGLFYPKKWMKSYGQALDWYPPVENFMLVKEVKVYNLLTHKYEIRRFRRSLLNKYKKEFYSKLSLMEKNYATLHEDYKQAFNEFTTFEFWENYLGVKVEEKNEQRVCI